MTAREFGAALRYAARSEMIVGEIGVAISEWWRTGGWKTGWLNYRRKRFWTWVAVVAYTLVGFVIVPWIARGVIVDQIHKQLGLTAKLDKVELNPYALIVRLEGFSMNERGGRQMIAFDEFEANLQLSSIFRRAWTFADIRIVHPYVRIEHNEETGKLNLMQLVPPTDPHAKPEPEAESPPPRVIIDEATIEGGRASVADKTERQTYETELGPVDLTMTTISTLPNQEGKQTLAIRTGFGGQLEWKGDLGLTPLRSKGHISFNGEELAPITAYLPPELKMVINDGRLDVAFDYDMAEIKSGVSLDVSNIAFKLVKLGVAQTVDGPPTEWLGLDEFALDGGRFQWPEKKFAAQRIALVAPKIAMGRDAQQRFIWERLWQGDSTATPTTPSGGAAPSSAMKTTPEATTGVSDAAASVAGNAPAPNADAATSAAAAASSAAPSSATAPAVMSSGSPAVAASGAESSWAVDIARFEITRGHVGFTDQTLDPAATVGISELATTLEHVTLADGATMPFTLNFNVDGGGNVALNGTVVALPAVQLDAQAKIDDVALATINPYLNATTYLQIASGVLGVDGHLLSKPDDALSFDGGITVANLDVLREGIDGRLMGLKDMSMTGVTMSLAKKHVDLARIDLDQAYARIHISKDRVVNFATVTRETPVGSGAATTSAHGDTAAVATNGPVVGATTSGAAQGNSSPPTVSDTAQAASTQPAAKQKGKPSKASSRKSKQIATADGAPVQVAEAPPAPAGDEWSIKLGRLKVTNADVDFSDDSLPIPFSRSISKLSGGIESFDTTSRAPTQLKFIGQVGEYGELKLSGSLRALDPLKQASITASFKNLDMPGASAYAIRFAGRKVQSGRLDMDMTYTLRDGMLEGKHKIVVRDFQLGEKVPYPDALNLPYDLAISLLKDSNGNINVDLPVEGNVNDPTFRIGGVIMRALANLITQIITSPFRLLGRLVGLGDSEGLDQVLFEPGSSDLAPPEREKIAKVSDALAQRPTLALTVHGTSNQLADAEALRSASVHARLHERVGDRDAAGRLKVVEKMVKESIPGLSLDPIKAANSVPPNPGAKPVLDEGAYLNALIAKLIAAEPLPPNAVESLAAARANAVRDAFAESPALEARITIGDPKETALQNDEVPLKFELTVH